MLIVLMAIIDFSRMKVHAATRWLWLALSGGMFVAAPVGCERECNCRCECGQPAAEQATPATATPVPDKVDTPDARIGGATEDAGAAAPVAAQADVKETGDAGGKAAEKPADTTKRPTRRTPRQPAKPVPTPVVPDVPQVAYGPPPVIDPGREIQPLYGVPMERDPMPQLMYGPPRYTPEQDSK